MAMVAGLSAQQEMGKMARLVAEAIVSQEDMELYPYALSEEKGVTLIADERSPEAVRLIPTDEHTDFLRSRKDIDMVVDFTQPKAVNRNAELYCQAGVPFVMGTTGGDRQKLEETVKKSCVSAVIAPNMASPVVMFQAMLEYAAKNFPNVLEGWQLLIEESHQAGKKDPSGTAVSLLEFFAALGMPYTKEQIADNMVRDPVVQEVKLGVPKKYIGGHAYHTYTMMSPDGTVKLQFTYNVLGRNVYVDGVLRAIRFLARHKVEKDIFTMAEVLQG